MTTCSTGFVDSIEKGWEVARRFGCCPSNPTVSPQAPRPIKFFQWSDSFANLADREIDVRVNQAECNEAIRGSGCEPSMMNGWIDGCAAFATHQSNKCFDSIGDGLRVIYEGIPS